MSNRIVTKKMRKASRFYNGVVRPAAKGMEQMADRTRKSESKGYKSTAKAPRGGRR